MEILQIGVKAKRGRQYVYVDYEPPQDTRFRRSVGNKEIIAWVLEEYGLEASSPQVTYVKRKHGAATRGIRSGPLLEGIEPPKIPAEIESAIEAALRYFRMI